MTIQDLKKVLEMIKRLLNDGQISEANHQLDWLLNEMKKNGITLVSL